MAAIISPCGTYRYRLERPDVFGDHSTAVIMVNPSTADADIDDATIRKLKGFRDRNGWGNLIVGNLFGQRTTDIRVLGRGGVPAAGPDNDAHLAAIFADAQHLVVAWGPMSKLPASLRGRWRRVMEIAHAANPALQPYSIGLPAKDGHPRHPLMLGYAEPLMRWRLPL